MYKPAIRLKNKVKYPYNKCYTISTYTCSLKQTVTISFNECQKQAGLVAQRITRLTTDQKIAGSNPAEIEIFHTIFSYKLCCHDKICAPGWARTTNLSVNSRTR